MRNWCASISAASRMRKKPRRRRRWRRLRRRKGRRRSRGVQRQPRPLRRAACRRAPAARVCSGDGCKTGCSRLMHPQLALRLLRELRDVRAPAGATAAHPATHRAPDCAAPAAAAKPAALHQRLLLRLPLHAPALRRYHPRRVLACHCGLAATPERAFGSAPCWRPLGHFCNVIRVRRAASSVPGQRVLVRRKACARRAPRADLSPSSAPQGRPGARPGRVPVDLLRGSRSAPAVAATRRSRPMKDRSAHGAPAPEFPRRSQASRSMRASRLHAVGR